MPAFDPAVAGLNPISALTADTFTFVLSGIIFDLTEQPVEWQRFNQPPEVSGEYPEDVSGLDGFMVTDMQGNHSIAMSSVIVVPGDPALVFAAPVEGLGFFDPLNPCTGGSGGARPDDGLLYPRGNG